uniref:Uncharacterized protein n=1 Tax=Corethron hystrix TaxID=216773 RepID=A0A7S1BYS8_9STRA|mmetsp:Transcript_4843/g.9588  ORF Transcript_4843/g.9588 Transcript_4843/m.9588 type:complete len:242 (+) Transcript_4843:102-827(+)
MLICLLLLVKPSTGNNNSNMVRYTFVAVMSLFFASSNSFLLPHHISKSQSKTALFSAESHDVDQSRRELFRKVVTVLASSTGVMISNPRLSLAASKDPPTKEEMQRIKTGSEQIKYLLSNWDQCTTTCRENGGECKRDAEPVRRYMGLRSTTDPLFQIEKVFDKVKNMDDIDIDKLEDFFTATEEWNTAVNMSNSMAFISQFGEYNPGGGKDEVLKYLIESKKQVVIADKSLTTIIGILGI